MDAARGVGVDLRDTLRGCCGHGFDELAAGEGCDVVWGFGGVFGEECGLGNGDCFVVGRCAAGVDECDFDGGAVGEDLRAKEEEFGEFGVERAEEDYMWHFDGENS